MSPNETSHTHVFQDKAFLLLVIAVSVAFGWTIWPFFAPVFWAAALAILFAPFFRRLCTSLRGKRTPAALLTLMIILVMVVLPTVLITLMLVQEGLSVYGRMRSGDLNLGRAAQQVFAALPPSISSVLERFGVTTLNDVQERVSDGLMKSVQFFATNALNVGQNTLEFVLNFFVMLYLLFFLLRDGGELARRVRKAIPLRETLQRDLFSKFSNVIRATIKGSIVTAIVQGTLGGLMFWFLGIRSAIFWAVLMAFLSLLPAIGTAIVWLPVALYFLATGAIWQGVALILFGVLVIGLVDNALRPVLVGKDTQMPDYIVFISSLGGIAIFGFKGFVIGPAIAALFIAVWDTVASARTGPKSAPFIDGAVADTKQPSVTSS